MLVTKGSQANPPPGIALLHWELPHSKLPPFQGQPASNNWSVWGAMGNYSAGSPSPKRAAQLLPLQVLSPSGMTPKQPQVNLLQEILLQVDFLGSLSQNTRLKLLERIWCGLEWESSVPIFIFSLKKNDTPLGLKLLRNFGISVAKQEKILNAMKMIVIKTNVFYITFFKKHTHTKAPKYHFKIRLVKNILTRRFLLEILRQRTMLISRFICLLLLLLFLEVNCLV